MTKALEPVSRAGRVLFELDRFELVEDRYELEGRWSGVRGRRFIRPTLTLVADGRPMRLLADLAHKPWAAEDGESWKAAFPYRLDHEEVVEAELTVAPDIAIALAPPGHARAAASRPRPPSGGRDRATGSGGPPREHAEALAEAKQGQRRLQSELDRVRTDEARTAARIDELLGRLSQAMRERDQAQATRDELETELEALRREHARLASERDAARQSGEDAAADRAALIRARDEAERASEAASSARDDAMAQRGGAITARAQAESARDAALAAQAQAETERDAALALRDHALAGRDAALAERDDALANRQAAISARDDALRERDSYRGALEQVQSEHARQASARGAALVMRQAIQEPPAFRAQRPILPRALAIILLLAILVALMIVLRVA